MRGIKKIENINYLNKDKLKKIILVLTLAKENKKYIRCLEETNNQTQIAFCLWSVDTTFIF